MKKFIKVIVVLAVILVVAVAGVLIAAKIYITPERVRQVVVPLVEEELDRPVSIGDINVRIFSGIVISDFTVGAKENGGDFISAGALVLRYRFLPLLRLSVIVDEIRLDSPDIRVERYENGDFNFSDLIAGKPSEEDAPVDSSGIDARENETSDGLPIDLVVNEISISGGRLVFMDHMVDREYQLTDLFLSATGFSLDRSFPFVLSAKINNAPVDTDGTINLAASRVTAGIRLQDFDVAAFMPYAADDFPGELSGMKLSIDIKADATPDAVDTSGRIEVSEIDMLIDAMPGAPLENARVFLDYDLDIDVSAEHIIISRADANINGILFEVSGSVSSFTNNPVLDITANMPMMFISDVVAAGPGQLAERFAGMRLSGRIGAGFHLAGSPDKPEEIVKNGEIILEKIGATVNDLSSEISGTINIAKDTAASDNLSVNLGGDLVEMEFAAENLMGEIIRVKHSVSAASLDIDRLLEAMGVEEAERRKEEEAPDQQEEPGPFDLPLFVDGDIRVATAVFHGLSVSDFNLEYVLENNILTVQELRGDVAGGRITGKARTELNRQPIAYTADISVEDSRAENILNALFPRAANTVFGAMNLKADIKGEGTTWGVIRRSLTSRADVNVSDGRLTGTGLAGGLAGFLDTGRLEVLGFDSLRGNVQLEDGKFRLDSRYDADDIKMSPTGSIGLDGALNLSLDMRVSPEIASQIGAGNLYSQLAQTGDGWTLLPVKVDGTVRSPRFALDSSAVSDQIRQRGEQELQKQFQDRVLDRVRPKDDEETGEESGENDKPSIERQLEDTIRNLFN